jgi:mediator of RNA polymerase II transcription subunit 13, fungi type
MNWMVCPLLRDIYVLLMFLYFLAWTAHLATSLQVASSRAPVHVSLVSVETSAPWTILPKRPRPTSLSSSHSSSSLTKAPSLSRSSSLPSKSSSKNGIQYYIDGSQTTYALFHRCSPTFTRAPTMESVGITTSIVTDSPPERSEHTLELPVLPLCSSTLVRIPASASPSASAITPNMIDLHLLHTASSRGCTYLPSRTRGSDVPVSSASQPHWGLMNDIIHSYHALSILSESRSKLSGVNTLLPFHLGAVEAMRNALSFGRVQTDGYD